MFLNKDKTKFTNFIVSTLYVNGLVDEAPENIIITGRTSIEMASLDANVVDLRKDIHDIDILIVVDRMSFLNRLFDSEVIEQFKQDNINVLNYSFMYGSNGNFLQIKYIKHTTFYDFLSFKKNITCNIYRKNSFASGKPSQKLYSWHDFLEIQYKEEKKKDDFYLVQYNFKPIQNGRYYLSKIHAILFFATIIKGKESREMLQFNLFFRRMLDYSDEALCRLFHYFIDDEKSISVDKIRFMIEYFSRIRNVVQK